jgi:hypothetical protein
MHPLWNKLNYKDHSLVHIQRAPKAFEPMLEELFCAIHLVNDGDIVENVTFVVAFATTL